MINNEQIMFEYDVAEFFKTTVNNILSIVKENPNHFPDDFIYHLTEREFQLLIEQFPNSNLQKQVYIPLGFTDSGMAMLSAYINTNEAIDYHVSVIRMFNDFNKTSKELSNIDLRITSLEYRMEEQFEAMNDALDKICKNNNINRSPIGFKSNK